MKLMRLALCVAVFALVGGIAFSEDMDIRALQAKLAAQEARLNDLQAKMGAKSGGGTADNVVSLRKNAKVVIGGDLNFRIYHYEGKVETKGAKGQKWNEAKKLKATDLVTNDVKFRMAIDVNDYFDAYLRADFQSGDKDTGWKQAQTAWVRWKNVCNSGFSLKVGRDGVVYGAGTQHGGTWDGFLGGNGEEAINKIDLGGKFISKHIGPSPSRTTQITASWQNPEGNFIAELSYLQAIDVKDGGRYYDEYDHVGEKAVSTRYKSLNQGFGSGSARLTWLPIEGLKLVGSAINLHSDTDYVYAGGGQGQSKHTAANHTAVSGAIVWNPCFAPQFKVWGQYARDWNAGWVEDVDVDKFQLGASYTAGKLHLYTFGEYMVQDNFGYNNVGVKDHKTKGWSGQVGAKYTIGYGVWTELVYRYEKFESKVKGFKYAKADIHSIHARLNFEF